MIYCKKLADEIKEVQKSQDLQSANWRLGRANEWFGSESTGLRTMRADGVISSLSPTPGAGED